MLTPKSIETLNAGKILKYPLKAFAPDSTFLDAVLRVSQRKPKTPQGMELMAWLDGIVHGKRTAEMQTEVAFSIASMKAAVAVGSRGPGVRWSMRPVLVPQTLREVYACATALLMDDDLPFGADLRRCALDGCGLFFLVDRSKGGRPRETYCSQKHMETAQLATASKRASESRTRRIARERRTARKLK